ncbi:hypothetical protein [Nostoc sp. MG11]|uniref:hypothetical protein n=1 Tax=Nostoc sp. MG11 TaxID=2721166 RepID=UPI0018680A2A|nr:hypothetical protein [Nostoc sp. MG11]
MNRTGTLNRRLKTACQLLTYGNAKSEQVGKAAHSAVFATQCFPNALARLHRQNPPLQVSFLFARAEVDTYERCFTTFWYLRQPPLKFISVVSFILVVPMS